MCRTCFIYVRQRLLCNSIVNPHAIESNILCVTKNNLISIHHETDN